GDKGDKGDTGAAGPQGDKGDKGDTGAAGPQGVGIKNAEINAAGELVITLTDDRVINCGKVTGGGSGETGTPDTQLAAELAAALSATELKGVNFRAEAVIGSSLNVIDGKADFTREGFYADMVTYSTLSSGGQSYNAMYFRGDAAYEANWQNGGNGGNVDVSFDAIYKMVVEQGFEGSIDELMKFAEDWGVENGNAYIVIGGERIDLGPITGGGSEEASYATVNEFLEAISSGEYLLKKYNVESGGMVAFSSPFVMKVLKNVPAALGGTAAATADGYALTYNIAQTAEQLYETARLLAAAVDADKTMTVGEAIEYAPVKSLLQSLLKGVTAQETADFAKLVMSAQNGEMTDEIFYQAFPRPEAEADAWAYLGACLSSEALSQALFQLPEALGTLNVYDLLCGAIYGIDTAGLPDALLPSMENAVKSFWESQRANAENSNSSYWYEMLFSKDAPEITFLFDADKKLVAAEADVKIVGETDGGRDVMTVSARADFLPAAPELFDLTGCKCIAGYTYAAAEETKSVSVSFRGFGEVTRYFNDRTGAQLFEAYLDAGAQIMFTVYDYGKISYATANQSGALEQDSDGRWYYYDDNKEQIFVEKEYIYSLDKYYFEENDKQFYLLENETFYLVSFDKETGAMTKGEVADYIRAESNREETEVAATFDITFTVADNTATTVVKCGDQTLGTVSQALKTEIDTIYLFSFGGRVDEPSRFEQIEIREITINGVTYTDVYLYISLDVYRVEIGGDGQEIIEFSAAGTPVVETIA
ncbi:MAG: collagen-like protein, partial [Christensenellaceae bacterium]